MPLVKPDPDNVNEFRKSYTDSWFGIKLEGKVYPAQIDINYSSNTNLGYVYLPSAEATPSERKTGNLVWTAERDTLLRDYPTLGTIKLGPTVAYLKVKPKRQWKKGYFPNNVLLHVPNSEVIKKHLPRLHIGPANRAVVWQIFNREYWNPHKAMSDILNGEALGYPLSRCFSMFVTDLSKHPLIGYKSEIVGAATPNGFELMENFKYLKEQWKRETNTECT